MWHEQVLGLALVLVLGLVPGPVPGPVPGLVLGLGLELVPWLCPCSLAPGASTAPPPFPSFRLSIV